MALPLGDINAGGLLLLANAMQTVWNNPENPALNFLSKDFVALEGYTPFNNNYPISQNVLSHPVAAAYANPRAALPSIDGAGTITQTIKPVELKVPLDDSTMDEFEEQTLMLRTFGIDPQGQATANFEAERWAARLAFGKLAMSNRFEIMTMGLIETCSIITPETHALSISNTFSRTAMSAVGDITKTDFGYADLTAGALIGLRWVNIDKTLNASATPVNDVQVQIATLKRYGGGGAKYFVMSPLAMAAYQADFKANYADLAKNTIVTVGGNAAIEIPQHLMQMGWSHVGYVHDFANNYNLIPVYSGASIQYKDWTDADTLKDFLPTDEFCFPAPKTPTLGQRFTYVNLKRVKDQKTLLPINIYMDEESGDRRGSILHKGYMFPNKNPNALVYWKVG